MKVVILAGGLGTRISEYSKFIPKPMISVVGKPIIHRIIDHYYMYGHKEFYIALGYKGEKIIKYFKQKKIDKKIKINFIKTGLKTMTGGRLKRLKFFLDDTFLMTYGDGLSNVDISKLIRFHKKNKKQITITAVRPPARFGAIKIKKNIVKYFREKNNVDEGWINGGFFVIEPGFIQSIKNDDTYLEREPFLKATKRKQMVAYQHRGFWQCMDTLRDKNYLNNLYKANKLNWLK